MKSIFEIVNFQNYRPRLRPALLVGGKPYSYNNTINDKAGCEPEPDFNWVNLKQVEFQTTPWKSGIK